MAKLKSIAELRYRQLFPNPGQTKLTVWDFIATAKTEYASALWLQAKQERRTEGIYNIPPYLLTSKELDVVDSKVDISGIKYLKSLPSGTAIQSLYGNCRYVRSNVNMQQLLEGDDCMEDKKPFLIINTDILFPSGTTDKKVTIVYANMGENIDGDIEVDESVGSIISDRLLTIYAGPGRIGKEDITNNENDES